MKPGFLMFNSGNCRLPLGVESGVIIYPREAMMMENPMTPIPNRAELFLCRRCHIIAENEKEERLRFIKLNIISRQGLVFS